MWLRYLGKYRTARGMVFMAWIDDTIKLFYCALPEMSTVSSSWYAHQMRNYNLNIFILIRWTNSIFSNICIIKLGKELHFVQKVLVDQTNITDYISIIDFSNLLHYPPPLVHKFIPAKSQWAIQIIATRWWNDSFFHSVLFQKHFIEGQRFPAVWIVSGPPLPDIKSNLNIKSNQINFFMIWNKNIS